MNHRIKCLVVVTLAASFSSAIVINAQTLNPAYLSEMPSPARVLNEIKGKDAEDTIERQMGAFQALMKMIDDMAYGMEHRYLPLRATPDENRIKLAYGQAYADLWHAAKNKEDHLYDHDWALLGEMLTNLFSQNFRTIFAKSDANSETYYKEYRLMNSGVVSGPTAGQKPASAAAAPAVPTPPAPPAVVSAANTAAAPGMPVAMRRCLESGRSQRICYSESMSDGMDQLIGISLKMPSTAGLRMTGDYSGPQGIRLIFQPEKAVLTCSQVSSPLPYTVDVTATQVLIKLQNASKPVVFELRPDGKLAGSGQIKIEGITATGMGTEQTMGPTTQTTTTTRELTPLEAQNYPNARQNGQTFTTTENSTTTTFGPTGTRPVVNYQNRTADCTLGLMTPTGPTPLPPDIENPMGLLTSIFSGASVLMNGGTVKDATANMLGQDNAPAPGLRMAGTYSGANGFSLTFNPESVTVACRDAERALDYSVQRSANQIVFKLQDKTDPITLQLKPDGSLFGEGTAQVNGRTLIGTTDDTNNPFTFAPKIGRCPMGNLVPAK